MKGEEGGNEGHSSEIRKDKRYNTYLGSGRGGSFV